MIIDNDLIFDKKSKRYYLTEEYVLNELNTDIKQLQIDDFATNLSTLAIHNIKWACDIVYDFLCKNAVHRLSALYFATKNEEAHECLKRALSYQLLDFIQNGDASMEHGGKVSDTVNNRAIQALQEGDLFTIICPKIPKDVNEW